MSKLVYSDKYEVQEEIAQGGMGVVYKALDRKLNRVVAIKVVHPHLTSDSSFLQRFLREARAMARLQHEHIVSIFSVEQDRGAQFIVMEYFEGTNLLRKIQSGVSFPLHEAITITYQIAKALAYAHQHGIIHRDVKPGNVLLGSDDRIKLMDFGIAAALDEAPLTSAGQLIGTLLYMSPEQARDATLDGRSDLYSLGLMFYEMLTGTHPRRNLSNVAILGLLAEQKTLPLAFPSSVPAEVQAIVKDLLPYLPADRIKDASQLLRRLESLQALGGPVASSSVDPNLPASDETIYEMPTEPAAPAKKKPENAVRQPESSSRIVTILLISAAVVVASGAGLYYTLLPTPSTSPIVVTPPTSVPPKENQPPAESNEQVLVAKAAPTLPQSAPAPVPPPRATTSNQTPVQPKPEPTTTSTPKVPKAEPKPKTVQATPTPPLSPPIETARLMKSNQGALDLLDQLKRLVAEKNFAALDEISDMSEDRRSFLESLFANYSTIEASLGELVTTPTGVTTVLRIDKLALLTGEAVTPGSSLRKIRLTVPREGEGWGPIVW